MAIVYLIRHGQTHYNLEGKLTGRGSDPELTEVGKAQADQAGKLLKLGANISLIVSSNMTRTNQTAEIINQHLNLEIHLDNDLQEKDKGGLEGALIEFGLPLLESLEGHETHPVYGGESNDEFKDRIIPSICKYLNLSVEGVLLVSHGFVGAIASQVFFEEKTTFHNAHYMEFNPAAIIDLAGKCSFD